MNDKQSDNKTDILKALDRGENLSMMEPLLIFENSIHRRKLTDLVMELVQKAAGFKHSLPPAFQDSLAIMVRAMNCYYSNLIEGHNTHPIEIERALQEHYDADLKKRNLQKEAKAHIAVQEWIDNGGIKDNLFSINTICEIHKRFYDLLPEDLMWVKDPETKKKIKVTPGKLRQNDVKVGNHIAISPGAIPRFLKRFESVYSKLGKTETILSLAAAHHRLLWIHPFLDGNGRVTRLMSHTTILSTLNTDGIWSISRGLARNVNDYKALLANCDLPKRNDLDGRGNLSEETLVDFTRFFLETCIDQIEFMEKLMQPELLRRRILSWVNEEIQLGKLPPKSAQILKAVLYQGEISRGEISNLLNVTDRHARRISSSLIEKGVLKAETSKSPLKIAFPATLAHRWMPGLFPPS